MSEQPKARPKLWSSAVIAAVVATVCSAIPLQFVGAVEIGWLHYVVKPLFVIGCVGLLTGMMRSTSGLGIFLIALVINFLLYWPLIHAFRLLPRWMGRLFG